MRENKEAKQTEGCTFKPETLQLDESFQKTMQASNRSFMNGSFNSYAGGFHRRKSPSGTD